MGARTNIRGDLPCLLDKDLLDDIRDKAGILKANVLPEPVSAMPTTSLYRPLESELSRIGCVYVCVCIYFEHIMCVSYM